MGCNVIVSAGSGYKANQDPADERKSNIRCPGNARDVVTVDGLDKSKSLPSFSSRGRETARLEPLSPTRMSIPDLSAVWVFIISSIP